jgi:hypothetical protein
MRVITKTKEVTRNQEEAENDIDVAVFGMHCNAKQVNRIKIFFELTIKILNTKF